MYGWVDGDAVTEIGWLLGRPGQGGRACSQSRGGGDQPGRAEVRFRDGEHGVWIWGVQNTGSPTPPILQVEEERRSAAGSEKEEEPEEEEEEEEEEEYDEEEEEEDDDRPPKKPRHGGFILDEAGM